MNWVNWGIVVVEMRNLCRIVASLMGQAAASVDTVGQPVGQ